jgi:hypothetical protein
MKFSCPKCATVFRLDVDPHDRNIVCPVCTKRLSIPLKSTGGQQHPPALLDDPGSSRDSDQWPPDFLSSPVTSKDRLGTSRRRKKRSGALLFVFVACVALVLAGFAFLASSGSLQAERTKSVAEKVPSTASQFHSENAAAAHVMNQAVPTQQKAAEKPGKVRANVTWEYNKFVGNKPDTDSVVFLIPKSMHEKVSNAGLDPFSGRSSFRDKQKSLRAKNVFVGIIGGNGSTLIDEVVPGDYTVIIISRHTNDASEVSDRNVAQLEKFFEDGGTASIHKAYLDEISVRAGEEVEISHDFGVTNIAVGI